MAKPVVQMLTFVVTYTDSNDVRQSYVWHEHAAWQHVSEHHVCSWTGHCAKVKRHYDSQRKKSLLSLLPCFGASEYHMVSTWSYITSMWSLYLYLNQIKDLFRHVLESSCFVVDGSWNILVSACSKMVRFIMLGNILCHTTYAVFYCCHNLTVYSVMWLTMLRITLQSKNIINNESNYINKFNLTVHVRRLHQTFINLIREDAELHKIHLCCRLRK